MPLSQKKTVAEIIEIAPEFIIKTVKAGSVEIVSKAKIQSGAVSPNIKQNTLIGGLLGFMISTLAFIIITLFDKSIRSKEDIEDLLDINVIGVIPVVKEGVQNEEKKYSKKFN